MKHATFVDKLLFKTYRAGLKPFSDNAVPRWYQRPPVFLFIIHIHIENIIHSLFWKDSYLRNNGDNTTPFTKNLLNPTMHVLIRWTNNYNLNSTRVQTHPNSPPKRAFIVVHYFPLISNGSQDLFFINYLNFRFHQPTKRNLVFTI